MAADPLDCFTVEQFSFGGKVRDVHRAGAGTAVIVTEDLVDEPGQPTRAALEQVLVFLDERLASPEEARHA